MIELPTDLPADLAPLSWLVGDWEGTGVIDYEADGTRFTGEFTHRVTFQRGGGDALEYSATAWLAAPDGEESVPLVAESGFWRLSRPATPGDSGPALLPPRTPAAPRTVDDVEALRTESGGFPLEVSLAHADGTLELYLGEIVGPRIDIATDAIVRAPGGRDYGSATRMYGLVDGHLLWAWDIAALGSSLASHASARLARL